MKRILELIGVITLVSGCITPSSAWAEEEKATVLDHAAELGVSPPHDEFIHSVGYLRAMEHWDYLDESRRAGLTAMHDAVLGVPRYTEYFERELDLLRSASRKESIRFTHKRKLRVFQPLQYLKAPESVDLLIRLLDDDADFKAAPESPPGISIPDRPGNDILAEGVLMEMIADLPLNRNRFGGYYRDLPALKKWGAEVRSGERTFRFVGDPQIYAIDGPVEREGIATSGTEGLNLSRRPLEIPDSPTTDATRSNGFPWLPVGGALLFLLAGLGAFLRSRRSWG